jgi:hypothetical protein
MRKQLCGILMVCMLAGVAATAPAAFAGPGERYLHVKVEDAAKGESVNVNVPLSMAEKILPTVNKGGLHNGHVSIGSAEMNDVDVRALLDAVRTAPDNEFVTVKEKDQDVRIAKSNGNIVIHVRRKQGRPESGYHSSDEGGGCVAIRHERDQRARHFRCYSGVERCRGRATDYRGGCDGTRTHLG